MRSCKCMRTLLACAAGAAMLAAGAAPAHAQNTGTVQGVVVGAETQQPLTGAQVFLEGTGRGTLTNQDGRFLLLNVPVGSYTLGVRLIGYSAAERTITVPSGGTVTANFELEASAIALDAIVVTGQGGETRKREIGAVVSVVSAEELETAPIANVTQMLQARVPGLTILPGGGKVGQGTKIMLRGPTSLSQGTSPVIYVDGVRIDNSTATGVFTGGSTWKGLGDLNPNNIERIEVVKGAAASTMYGTEASAGVIQIFTKKGRQGDEMRWTYSGEYGFSRTPRSWWNVSLYSDWFYNNYVSIGPRQEHQISTSGGQEGFSYFASAMYSNAQGTLPNNGVEHYSFRGNLQLFPAEDLILRLNTGYSQRSVEMPQDANNIYGYAINALGGGKAGLFMPIDAIDLIEVFLQSNRFTGSMTAQYNPSDNFTNRLVIGADVVTMDNTGFHPYGANSFNPQGRKTDYRRHATSLTFEYIGSLDYRLSDALTSNTTAGFQAYRKNIGSNEAYGENFPVPGLSTVAATSNTSGSEFRLTTKSAGFFIKQRLGFKSLLFLNVGARADGHSAFGEEYPYQIYPSVGASYVISDHGFWPEWAGTMRLRAAYGTAGRQPGAFDAARMWNPTAGFEGEPAVEPDNLGNANLAPEISHEYEFGFDAGLLDGRLGLNVTYYRQRTEDALMEVRYPPSEGFLDPQYENVGEVVNRGFEVGLNATLVEAADVLWTAYANLSTNHNEVTDLGGVPELYVQWTQKTREGYPIGSFFGDHFVVENGEVVVAEDQPFLLNEDGTIKLDENGDPIPNPNNAGYIGPPFPTRTFQLGSSVTLWDRVHVRALLDHAGGHFTESSTVRWLTRVNVRQNDAVLPEASWGQPVASWCVSPSDPTVQAMCEEPWPQSGRGNVVQPADYWKLREVTISYNVPRDWLGGMGVRSANVYISGRNLWRHQKTLGLEAEANYDTGDDLAQQAYFVTPIPQTFIAGIRVNF